MIYFRRYLVLKNATYEVKCVIDFSISFQEEHRHVNAFKIGSVVTEFRI